MAKNANSSGPNAALHAAGAEGFLIYCSKTIFSASQKSRPHGKDFFKSGVDTGPALLFKRSSLAGLTASPPSQGIQLSKPLGSKPGQPAVTHSSRKNPAVQPPGGSVFANS